MQHPFRTPLLALAAATALAFAGCATDKPESDDAICGDGIVEGSEECDDGNMTAGDGCSPSCVVEDVIEPFCGDGVLDAGEQCDDGNTTSGDGCDADCQQETTGPRCGNGVRELGEECDDGNTADGDGCDSSCQFESSLPFCGNGVREAGEECDDGNATPGDGCDASCQLEAGVCGDGTVNDGEQCDDGNTANGDGCDASCQLEGAVCGNGTVDSGEQCDDGNTANNDGCSSTCRDEVCGDGIVQTSEQCDDGNTLDGDGCDSDCANEVEPGCGNGVLETSEECDDGNTTAGDGCDATCMLEATGLCSPDWTLYCGETDSWNTANAGSTNTIDSYACTSWNETGPEYAYTFIATTASDVTLRLSGTTADLDLFVLGEGAMGECAESNCLGFGDETVTFTTVPGETYFFVVDGYMGAESPYSIHVECGACGDGNVDPGEECDDGNTTAGDGCSDTCALEGCGNGVVDAGEDCDDSNTDACDGCSPTCQTEGCGNFVLECDEQCDDGNTADGDGCSATCETEGGICTPDFDLACGDTDVYNTTGAGSTDVVDFYSCTTWDEAGPEYAYTFTAAANGPVTVTLSGMTVDLDVFVLSNPADACVSSNCVAYGNTSATFTAAAGQTYYVVVDGYAGAEGAYTLNLSCGGGTCGDGVVNAGEECDDGGTSSNDGCSATCDREFCGDGIVQGPLGEECDDGNTSSGDGCTETCQSEAGACVPAFTLACAADDTWSNDGEGSTDAIDSYGCVAWDESGPEYAYEYIAVADTSVTVALSGMTADLDVFVVEDPGDGSCDPVANCLAYGGTEATFDAVAGTRYSIIVDGYAGATSDYTLAMSCAATTTCGDGTLEAGEQCDDGNTTAGDGCSATCTLEAGTCTAEYSLSCGGSDSWSTTYTGSTDRVDGYACATWNESGREYTYSYTAVADNDVTVTLTHADTIDLDVFVLLDAGAGCVAGNCVAHGDSSATFSANAGTTYFIVVDGFGGDEGSYDIDLGCAVPAAAE